MIVISPSKETHANDIVLLGGPIEVNRGFLFRSLKASPKIVTQACNPLCIGIARVGTCTIPFCRDRIFGE